jgi:putative heme-binding domain-containing protein
MDALPAGGGTLAEPVLRGLARGLEASGVRLIDQFDPDGRARLALNALLESARRTATDDGAAPASRAESARLLSLGPFDAVRDVLARLLDNREPVEVQLAALAALGRFNEPGVGELVVKRWTGFSPRVRAAALDVLFARPERASALLAAVEAGKVAAFDVDPSRLRVLEHSDDPSLRARAAKVAASMRLGQRDDVVAKYRKSLELTGDPAKGKATFQKTCAACHRLDGTGFEIGPNLAAMQNRGAEAILVNVLDPNREVNPQFLDYVVTTTDGRTLTGMLVAETANSLTLKRAENATDTVLRANIKQMRSGRVSIMPEGLEQQIDEQGMADLIAYVMSAK